MTDIMSSTTTTTTTTAVVNTPTVSKKRMRTEAKQNGTSAHKKEPSKKNIENNRVIMIKYTTLKEHAKTI